jgi:hypothetical protein
MTSPQNADAMPRSIQTAVGHILTRLYPNSCILAGREAYALARQSSSQHISAPAHCPIDAAPKRRI